MRIIIKNVPFCIIKKNHFVVKEKEKNVWHYARVFSIRRTASIFFLWQKSASGEVKCLAMVARPKGNHEACTRNLHMHVKEYISCGFFSLSRSKERKRKKKMKLSYHCISEQTTSFSYDNRWIINVGWWRKKRNLIEMS